MDKFERASWFAVFITTEDTASGIIFCNKQNEVTFQLLFAFMRLARDWHVGMQTTSVLHETPRDAELFAHWPRNCTRRLPLSFQVSENARCTTSGKTAKKPRRAPTLFMLKSIYIWGKIICLKVMRHKCLSVLSINYPEFSSNTSWMPRDPPPPNFTSVRRTGVDIRGGK